MVDPESQSAGDRPTESEVCAEIGRAVGSLRQRNSGARPASVRTEYVGDVIRCTIRDAESDGASEPPATGDRASIDTRRYRAGAEAAVTRLTGRRVVGFVAKAADEATMNTFILERVRIRY
jgi:hypothetical protein